MFEELGISFGTALIVLLALYFIIKWAVKNGIKEAYRDITGKVTTEDIEAEQICNEEEKLSIPIEISILFGNSEHPFPERKNMPFRSRVQPFI